MQKKTVQWIERVITFSPLAGIIGASFFNLTTIQHQLLILLLIIWANAFFLYKSWLS